ncbi:MAG: hypothetical protein R3B45_10535 [Bdellovibrionota bacterium]
MKDIAKAFSYLIAAQVQAVGIILFSLWAAKKLDELYPMRFTWLIVIIPIGILAVIHTFYLILRSLFWQKKAQSSSDEERGAQDTQKDESGA